MKTYCCLFNLFIILSVFALCNSEKLLAQRRNAVLNTEGAGTHFLVGFMPCYDMVIDSPWYKYEYVDIYFVGLDDTSLITINCREYPAYQKNITVLPHQTFVYRVSDDLNLHIYSSEKIENKLLNITSSSAISCYAMNNGRDGAADVFIVPSSIDAGEDYSVFSYPGFNILFPVSPNPRSASQFLVCAFENNTEVTIIPKVLTFSGSPAGKPLTFKLDSAQCVQVLAGPGKDTGFGLDLTGSIITSDKPVVVFSGANITRVPSIVWGDHQCDGSSFCELIPPISKWGKNFVFAATEPKRTFYSKAQVRILAINPNTKVKVNGIDWNPLLKAKQYRDTLLEDIVGIESDNPVLVADFSYDNICDPSVEIGSGFFVLLPPLEQQYKDGSFFLVADTITFPPSFQGSLEDLRFKRHYAQVTTESANTSNIVIDGNIQPSTVFQSVPTLLGGKQYSVATIELESGHHRISSINTGSFVAIAYGEGTSSAYAFPVSPSSNSLNKVIESDPKSNQCSIGLSIYPNPFTTSASIQVDFSQASDYSVQIIDDLGRKVLWIAEEKNFKGKRIFDVSGMNLSAGHYICELRSEKFGIIRRKSLIKL